LMVARDGVRSDACIENERQNVHVFSSAYSNIKGRENWSRGPSGVSIVLVPFTRRKIHPAESRNFNNGGV